MMSVMRAGGLISGLVMSVSLAAGAEVRRVPDVYTTIQAAIDAAGAGDTVLVADGVYAGEGNRDIDFRGKAITVRSESGPANCTIDCGGSEAEPHLGFCFHSAEGRDSVVEGFTILNGYHEEAGAIYCTYVSIRDPRGCSPTISNCIIRTNRGTRCGGIRCNSLCEPMISNCVIAENVGAHVGGISFSDECSPVVSGCIVRGNYGEYNGGIRTGGARCHGTIVNCVVSGNRSAWGTESAGIEWWAYEGSLTLTNCTIVNNAGGPGLLIGGGGDPVGTVTNCIVWGNTGNAWNSGQVYFWQMTPAITHCAIEGGWPGAGNINSDPFFVDVEGDDLRLLGGSPCLDAGVNSALPDGITADVAGQPRIANAIVDIGAYEGPNQGLAVLPRTLVLAEGQTACFTIRLGMDPGGSVVVDVAVTSGDPDITVASGAPLAFDSSNYAQPQTVTLAAAEDNDYENGSAVATVAASGFPAVSVQVAESDNDHILYVDASAQPVGAGTSWIDAFVNLQDALAAARRYDHIREIRVAQGVYRPDRGIDQTPGDRDASFELVNGVILEGGYAGLAGPDPDKRDITFHETILTGDLNGDDVSVETGADLLTEPTRVENSYHVVTSLGLPTCHPEVTTVLDGFTITGANANGPYSDGANRCCGGGLLQAYSGALKIANCVFQANTAEWGGAICGGRGPIVDCTIRDNAAAWAGGAVSDCSSVFQRCTIEGNYAVDRGGAVYLWEGNPRFEHCTISNNAAPAGGAILAADAEPVLVDCVLSGNRAAGGGAIHGTHYDNPAHLILTGCVLEGNIAEEYGGAIWVTDSALRLSHCTVAGNSAGLAGGAVACDDSSDSRINNCTFYENSAPVARAVSCASLYPDPSLTYIINSILRDGGQELWADDDSQIFVQYSNVQGGWEGVMIMDADPLFADADHRDFHLRSQAGRWDAAQGQWVQDEATSPCIDAGDPMDAVMHEPFPNGGVVNMGAYGGTAEASKSYFGKPICEVIVAGDIDGDCTVSLRDFAIMARHWLETY